MLDNKNINDIFQAINLFNKPKSKELFLKNGIKPSLPVIISYARESDILIFIPNSKSVPEILTTKNVSLIENKLNYSVYITKGKTPPDSTWLNGWRYGPLPNFLQHTFRSNQSRYITGPFSEEFLSKQNHNFFSLDNPYKYIDGFYATIIHEFGHAIFSDNTESVDTKFVKQFLSHSTPELFYPEKWILPELFAFCTEYSFSKSNFPEHAKKLEMLQNEIPKLIQNDTPTWHTPHVYALAMGVSVVKKHPQTWPSRLISRLTISI